MKTEINLSSKQIEDAFFATEDQNLIKNLRTLQKMDKTKKDLSAISGIHNEGILEKLVSLDIRPETLASFTIIPLIEIAWADGTPDIKEQKSILAIVNSQGIFKKGDINYELVKQWLKRKPQPELIDAWDTYIRSLCRHLPKEGKDILKKEIITNARIIAESSGGFLGIGKISDAEEKVIKKLEAAFE
jgi:hypothetical protein